MKKIIYSLIFLFSCFNTNAQINTSDNKVGEAFNKFYKLSRESIFLHLNKSTYIIGEDIWFKGYIYNKQMNEPFKGTSNVYVGIYDSIGNQIDKKLYFSDKGFTKGSISIDSTFASGVYYIKASTNWMKNFAENDAFIEKIKIYNGTITKTKVSETSDYDVQFLPEGGNLISGVQNTVGVKAINKYGYGVKIVKGIVRDESGSPISQFEGSVFGLGKFDISPEYKKKYSATLTFENGNEITYSLPESKEEGIGIIVRNSSEDKVMFVLTANNNTLEKMKDKNFFLLIHRDGIANKINVTFPENSLYAPFVLEKKTLQKGLNTITLFDDNENPVLERLFFNSYQMNVPEIKLSHSNIQNDSLTISIKTFSNSNVIKNMSISVLPENTLAYEHKNNILSTFLLKPYLKGFIENPSYYFKNSTPKKTSELDLLLLTQGWSRYSWDAIFNNPPKEVFEFENGITFNGIINSKINKKDKVFLHPNQKNASRIIDITQDGKKFNIPNYFPDKSEKIKLSLIKNNGNLIKPTIQMSIKDNNAIDSIKTWNDNVVEKNILNDDASNNFSDLISQKNVNQLDEVTVVQNRYTQNVDVPYIYRNKVTKVTKDIAETFPDFTDVMRNRGYNIRVNAELGYGTDRVTVVTRIPLSLVANSSKDVNISLPAPLIYVNGIQLSSFDALYELATADIDSYFIDRSGNGEGGGGAGVIRIYTKKDVGFSSILDEDKTISNKIYEYVTDKGFERAKQFYVPKYKTYSYKAFENFGVIHWLPEVITNEKGEAAFKILDTKTKNVSFFIEGMGEDGSLFSILKTVHLEPENKK